MTEEEQKEIQRVRRECDEHAAKEVREMLGFSCEDYWELRLSSDAEEGELFRTLNTRNKI